MLRRYIVFWLLKNPHLKSQKPLYNFLSDNAVQAQMRSLFPPESDLWCGRSRRVHIIQTSYNAFFGSNRAPVGESSGIAHINCP